MNLHPTIVFVVLFSSIILPIYFAFAEVENEGTFVLQPPKVAKAIPDWVKNQFSWYLSGDIDEKTLLASMNWMFDNNIMHLSPEAALEVQQLREENQKYQALLGHELTHVIQQSENSTENSNLLDARKSGNESSAIGTLRTAVVDIPNLDGSNYKVILIDNTGMDINKVVQQILRESYSDSTQDLKSYTDKVRYYNDLKEALRDELSDTRSQLSTSNPDVSEHEFVNPDINPDLLDSAFSDSQEEQKNTLMLKIDYGEKNISEISSKIQENLDSKKVLRTEINDLQEIISEDRWPTTFAYTDQSVDTKISLSSLDDALALFKKLNTQMETADDNGQMMQLQLQDVINKQQQAMQMLSNIMKNQHDTLMSIINNMR